MEKGISRCQMRIKGGTVGNWLPLSGKFYRDKANPHLPPPPSVPGAISFSNLEYLSKLYTRWRNLAMKIKFHRC